METQLLFSYGTLQLEKVQQESFGRLLLGKPEKLEGFRLERLKIKDPEVLQTSDQEYHPIAVETRNSGDVIAGTLFEITTLELKQADRYEVADYKRIKRTFTSGRKGWVYVRA